MDRGCIPLFRRIVESEVWTDPNLLKVWVDCLIHASWEEQVIPFLVGGRGGEQTISVTVQPGQLVVGRRLLESGTIE